MRPAGLGAALLLLLATPSFALKKERWFSPASTASPGVFLEVMSGEVLVKFSSGVTTAASRKQAVESLGGTVITDLAALGWVTVRLSTGMSVGGGLQAYRALPNVERVDPNQVVPMTRVPNDPQYASQYGLQQINAAEAWDYDTGGTNDVTIAVIDSGIAAAVAEVGTASGKLVGTSQFFNPNAGGAQSANDPPTNACTHATQVASVAAAHSDNATLVTGVSWGAKLISLKIFADGDCNPGGACPQGCETNAATIAAAIDYARTIHGTAGIGNVVVNLSVGGPGSCSAVTQTAITAAVNAGVVIVVSSGNDGSVVSNPANCSGVIPVGATNSSGEVAFFSNRGPELHANGLVAPGVNVRVATVGGGVTEVSGTSFAAPHVAGAAALILSAKPAFTPAQVRQTLRQSTNNIGAAGFGTASSTYGAGRLNAFLAMQLAVKGRIADTEGEEKVVAFPNPLRIGQASQTFFAIPASLQGDGASIKIYTVDGSFVRELNSLAWDGRNKAGNLVASGTYVFVYKTDSVTKTGRVAVIR